MFQIKVLGRRCAFDRDGSHLLCLGNHCGFMCSHVVEEATDSRQAVISSTYLVVPSLFKEDQKAPYLLAGQIR